MTKSQSEPRVFISYSHDSEEHRTWVRSLADELKKAEIQVRIDRDHLRLGSEGARFMQEEIRSADRVLVICTPEYNRKSDAGERGAGYESTVISAELVRDQNTCKFIPCMRGTSTLPNFLDGRVYIDFNHDDEFPDKLRELINDLRDTAPESNTYRNERGAMLDETGDLPIFPDFDSTVFFSTRFAQAFPGTRGIEWFRDPAIAMKRLRRLLSPPLVFRHPKNSDGEIKPIWWFRGRATNPVDSFTQLASDTGLVTVKEIKLDEVAAIEGEGYWSSFVYVKARPQPPSGANADCQIPEQLNRWAYATEEYAMFRGRPITLAEYFDGAAIIDGEPISLDGTVQRRVRYLTPYNFLIAAQESPINDEELDREFERSLDLLLRGEHTLDELADKVRQLPRRDV